jgi:hypothetical protein
MKTALRTLNARKSRPVLLLAASLAVATLVASTPADAQWGWRGGWGGVGWRGGWGGWRGGWGGWRGGWGGVGWRGGWGWGGGWGWRPGWGAAALTGAVIGYGLASPYYGYGYGYGSPYGYGYGGLYSYYPTASYYDYYDGDW